MKSFSRSTALHLLPAALVERLKGQFSAADFEAILQGFGAERQPALRLNPLVQEAQKTLADLRGEHVQLETVIGLSHAYRVRSHDEKFLLKTAAAQKGQFLLQGITSQLPVQILAPQTREKIWDMCAAPGSKTSQIAVALDKKGEIVASELDPVRFQKLQNTLRVQGCSDFVHVIQGDAIKIGSAYPEYFDAVLLDAPCSAEGRISLHEPRSYGFWSEQNIRTHAKLQRRLFRAAFRALKPSGRMIYSTCTLAPEENEGIVAWALQEFSDTLKQIPLQLNLPEVRQTHKAIQILPHARLEGFFVAAFRKK